MIPPSLLTDDARVAQEASIELLRIVAPLQLLSSLVFVGDGILQGSRDFKFEAFAVALASVGGAAVLILEQRPPDGALATAWDAVAVLNALRFLTFAGRFYLKGPGLATPSRRGDHARRRRRGEERAVTCGPIHTGDGVDAVAC